MLSTPRWTEAQCFINSIYWLFSLVLYLTNVVGVIDSKFLGSGTGDVGVADGQEVRSEHAHGHLDDVCQNWGSHNAPQEKEF